MPPTVLFLIDELDRWCGTETHLFRLLSHLDRDRIRPVVAIVGRAGLAHDFRALEVEVCELNLRRALSPEGVKGISALGHMLKRTRTALIVSYHTAADLLAPLAAALNQLPALSCRRDTGFTKKPVHIALQKRFNLLLHGMISVSDAVVEAVYQTESYPRSRNQTIHNGEDLDTFRPGTSPVRAQLGIPAGACVLCTVGSLSVVKDHGTHLEAFSRLARGDGDLHLLLAGDGPLRPKLEQLAHADRVHFLGQRDDVPDLLRASDIYVQTSLTEGFSNAILQAMATALPVVATRVGGNPELVTADSGLLVEPGDVDGLTAALGRLIAEPDLRRRMGQAARRHTEQHLSLETMVERYTRAFEQAIERK